VKRILPHPVLAAFVFAAWLLTAERITPGQGVLAAVAAVGGAWMMAALRLERAAPRRPLTMLRLLRDVVIDIVRSNIAVARLALGSSRDGHASFLRIPLEIRSHTGLGVLACIITATPGTIWVSYDTASGELLLHILDLVDERYWLDTIKDRYERRLMEIFE